MATVNEKMTAIADAIRDKTGGTEPLTLDDMAAKIAKVYDNGKTEENRAWWDVITAKNTKTVYMALFRSADFNLIKGGFNPPYTLKPTETMDNMFRLAKGLTKITKSQLDTSKCIAGNSIFEASDLQEIEEFSAEGYSKSIPIQWHFYGCTQLHTIGKFILKDDGSQTLTRNFINATNLQNITFEGKIGTTEDFSSCAKLTAKSIESIVSALSGTVSGQTLTFNTAVKATYYNAHSSKYANADKAWDALCDTKSNWTISLVGG